MWSRARQSCRRCINQNTGNRVDFEELDQYSLGDPLAFDRIQETIERHQTATREIILEMLNDLPSKDLKPPENVLFVCKLNKLTQERWA